MGKDKSNQKYEIQIFINSELVDTKLVESYELAKQMSSDIVRTRKFPLNTPFNVKVVAV